jgi:gas vesicle protein
MDKNGLSSFLLGLGVGVGIGMLFAPKSGSETRQLIKDKTGAGTDYLKQRSGELKQSASDLVDKGKDVVGRQRDTLVEALEAGKQAYRDAVGQPAPQPQPEGPAS